MSFEAGVIDVGPQRVQRNTTLVVTLGARDLGSAKTPGALNLDSLCTRTMARQLGRVDSNCDTSLSRWQIRAKEKVFDMYNEAHLNRIPMWKWWKTSLATPLKSRP